MRFRLPTLTDGERDTLLDVLDYMVRRLDERMGCSVLNEIDGFALKVTRKRVRDLRAKLFPDIRKDPVK